MRSFQTEYRAGANLRPIPNDLFARTKTRMEREAPRRRGKIRWSVLVPVCALLAIGSVSAVAYGVSHNIYPFSNSAYQTHINSGVPSAVTRAGAAVGKTVTAGGLSVTVKQTVCDNRKMYLSVEVQSEDGAPLQESTQFRKSLLARQEFAESNLSVGGQQYRCILFRTDSASDPDKASFEGLVPGDFTGLSGKAAVLTLKDFTDSVNSCEDAGFLFQNLGELYAKMTPEKPENFLRTGLYDVYADKSLVAPSWTIPAGKQEIKFSSQLPNSYIDNIGFHKTGEYGCQADLLYLSITPGSRADAEALKKLCFQNTKTGNPVLFDDGIITGNGVEDVGFSSGGAYKKAVEDDKNRKLAYSSGRIVLALDPREDNNTLTGGCSVKDLDHYRIMKNYQTEQVVRRSGKWEIPFTLQFTDTARNFTPNISFKTAGGHFVTIQKVSVSDLSFSFSGICKNADFSKEQTKTDLSTNHIGLILKNGSVVDAGVEVSCGGFGADGLFEFHVDLEKLVDARQVTAVEIWGTRVPLTD
jgi:hypothetical protein